MSRALDLLQGLRDQYGDRKMFMTMYDDECHEVGREEREYNEVYFDPIQEVLEEHERIEAYYVKLCQKNRKLELENYAKDKLIKFITPLIQQHVSIGEEINGSFYLELNGDRLHLPKEMVMQFKETFYDRANN